MYQTVPITRPIQSAEPTWEPVTLGEAKKQCEVAQDNGNHNEHLTRLIKEARETVEYDTGLAIGTRTFTYKLTEWPAQFLEIPLRPVTSITSIAYLDVDGASQTWSAANYVLETATVVQLVRRAYNVDWPSLRGDINGITVTLVAGYATALAVPETVKLAVLIMVRLLWQELLNPSEEAGYQRVLLRLLRSTYP